MSNISQITTYMVGEPVVYPQQGVGIVKEITLNKRTNITYYKIYFADSDMTFFTPVANVDEIGVRPIVSREEAEKAISSISHKGEATSSDWKIRYQISQNLLKEGTIQSVAKVVQTLYHRSKIKELPVQERKLYDTALLLLIDETSLALEKSKEEVQTLILSKLEK